MRSTIAPTRERFIAARSCLQRLVRHGDEEIVERLRAVSRGSVFGSPSSTILPCERNSTRSQTASTSYMLWLVHSTPQCPLSTNSAIPARMSRAVDGIDRGGRLVEQQQARAVQHRLGEAEPRLLARRQHARLGLAEAGEVEGREQRSIRSAQVAHGVDHAEDAQVLLDGQIAGQRRVDGGEVGARRAPGCDRAARSTPSITIRPAVGSSTPRIMLMVVVLPAPFGPSSPTISPGATWKRRVHRLQRPERLGEAFDGEDRGKAKTSARRIRPGVSASSWLRVSGLSCSARRAVDLTGREARVLGGELDVDRASSAGWPGRPSDVCPPNFSSFSCVAPPLTCSGVQIGPARRR